jgi:hypothetical protein
MFGASKYSALLRHPGYWKKDAAAPDYGPMAGASEKAAELGFELGTDQLDFAKQQYNDAMPLFQSLVNSQTAIQDETARQGKDYYDYMVANQRPVEQALQADAMAAGSVDSQEQKAGQAAADFRTQLGSQYDQAIRAGLRYGYDAKNMVGKVGGQGLAAAQAVAGGMNQAREKEAALGYAKKMDVAGLYRGLPGASQGAYGLALNAGNSAGQNQMAPGNQYMAGLGQGAGTIMQGQGQKMAGLGNILNAQTQMAISNNQGGLDVGGLLSGGAALIKAW